MTSDTKRRTLSILYYIGVVLLVLAGCELIPLITSLIAGETRFVFVFIASASVMVSAAMGLMVIGLKHRKAALGAGDGMIIASGSWLIGMLLCALPYYISGNYLSYLDCCFDVMSGLTTTGFTMIQNLDHLSAGLNMWRFLLTYIGGQGMVVLALSFLTKDTGCTYMMYVGEAKDEHLRPGAVSTSREIWKISLLYLALGWIVMTIAGLIAGLPLMKAILNGVWIFMSGWSTGGFAPYSQNILYYHSIWYEVATVLFFTIGSFNFALHYAVLKGNHKELKQNVEIISFTITVTITFLLVAYGLMKNGIYTDAVSLLRKGFYQLISGHTTTGFMTVYARQFYLQWGDIALAAMTVAMLIGGSACSTAGGFKGIRMGIIFKAIKAQINQYVYPSSKVQVTRMHHIHDVTVTHEMVRSAFVIVALYLVTFLIGTFAGMSAGFSYMESAFESASATGNVGLSIGVITTASPVYLKIIYIVIMWMARLEFISVLTLIVRVFRRFARR
jgi:trk system potassium uptake protein TrkH